MEYTIQYTKNDPPESLAHKRKRYGIVMLTGALLDLGFYIVGHYLHIPAWMDANGTAYAAMMLEPTAGLLVAFVISLYKAAFIYSSQDVIAYVMNAAIAIIIGVGIRKDGMLRIRRIIPLSILCFLVNLPLEFLVDLWKGQLVSHWELIFYSRALSDGFSAPAASLYAIARMRFNDCLLRILVLYAAWFLTPKRLPNQYFKDDAIAKATTSSVSSSSVSSKTS